jgi:chitinase
MIARAIAILLLAGTAQAGVINITRGGAYTFAIGNNNPSVPAVSIRTLEPVVLKNCAIFSHGTAVRAEVVGASLYLDHTTISILGAAGVGIGGTGKGIDAPEPNVLWIDHCEIDGAAAGIYVSGHPVESTPTSAQVIARFNRLTNCFNAIQLNGLHLDPNISIDWNEILSRPGCTDAINIFRSSGQPGRPIKIRSNYVYGVRPATPSETGFTASGIVTDGGTANPSLATSNVEIAYNQVVGCVTTGIALAFGLQQLAHDNVVVSSGLAADGTPYAWAWLGICIEGSGQPVEWLQWLQLKNNVVGCNDHTGARTDLFLWYPGESDAYCQGNSSLHDGPITLADEQAQWTAWKQKLASNHVTIGP